MCIVSYNCLVCARNDVHESFSSVDVHLKLRFDLIPNLVNVVKGYAKHEKDTLAQIVALRTNAQTATSEERIKLANEAVPLINRLYMLAESNPNLKSSELFLNLQRELVDVEDKITAARRFYNSSVKKYNNYVQVFPINITAKLFGFKKAEMFEIVENQRTALDIDFNK